MSGAKCKTCKGAGTGELAWGAIGTCPDCWGCGTNHASLDKSPAPAPQPEIRCPLCNITGPSKWFAFQGKEIICCAICQRDTVESTLARERESRKQAEAALREATVRCEHISFTFETPEEFRKNRTGAAYSSGYEAGWRDWCGSNPYAYSQQRYFDAYEAGWRTAQEAVKKKALRAAIPQEPAERERGK